MFKKLLKNLGRRAIESELDNLIERFSKANSEDVYILHSSAKNTPETWRLLFNDDAAAFCDNLLQVDRDSVTENIKKGIAQLGPLFTRVQRESNEEITKFGFWFWRVVFLSMIHPELENKGKHLGEIIEKQSDIYVSEFIKRAESLMGQKAQNVDSFRNETLAAVYPVFYN